MTTEINIYCGNDGFDTRLFFLGTSPIKINHPTFSFSSTIGDISFGSGGVEYDIEFNGTGFGFNTSHDFHTTAMSGTVYERVNGTDTSIASMVVFPDVSSSFDGLPINSVLGLTPDVMLSILADIGGGHLNFVGGAGNDKLYGSNLGDYFIGSDGNDLLTGYGGADQFTFDRVGKRDADHITDFRPGQDMVLIDRSEGQFKGVNAGNLQKTFHDITREAEQKDDRVLYDHDKGTLSYDSDGSGHKAAFVFAHLDNHASLNWRDFDLL
jgi:Ca2+-binding RTX toxin-like protein